MTDVLSLSEEAKLAKNGHGVVVATQAQHSDHSLAPTDKLRDGDEALYFLRNEVSDGEVIDVDEKRLLRKIDRMIMPLMFCCYCSQYLDKTLINYASVMGLLQDTHITSNKFANLALVFYVSYLFFEFSHAYAMQRLPTAKYLGTMVTLWGTVVTITSACNNYGSLITVRVFLGMFESAVAPALILITSMWYKKREQPFRLGVWYIGVGSANIIGSLLSFAFQHYHGKHFRSWQIMFLVIGLITVSVGLMTAWRLPDNPMSSRLTSAEKKVAVERVRENMTGIENKHFKRYQVVECFKDVQTWLISLTVISANISNEAVGSFSSLIIHSFGFASEQTALLQIPSGAIAVLAVLSATYLAGRYDCRSVIIMTYLAIGGVVGGALLAFIPTSHKGGALVGVYLVGTVGAALPCIYSWAACNFAGHTKKVTMNAILLMSFCAGNILGPLTFRQKDAPGYTPAKITVMATTALSMFFTAVLALYYRWENRRRDRKGSSAAVPVDLVADLAFADLTDKENGAFRYHL